MKKATPIFVKMGNSFHLHMSVILNLKPDMLLSVTKIFLKYREEDLERILSDEGILLKINRSIQAEGSFGELKQDMQFRRYLSRGTSNILAESVLLAMAKSVNKLHNKIQKGKTGKHLFTLKSA